MFEVGSMVSESVGRKSVGLELYFKSPKEGMDEIGKLEIDGDILLMTGLITEEVQYVEVFAVFIELEHLTVEGLPLGNTDIPPVIEVDDLTVEEFMQSSESSSTDETEQQVPMIKKKNIKSVGRKSTLRKKSSNRPIVGEGGNDGGRNADESGPNADEGGTDGNQGNEDGYEVEYEDHNDGGNEGRDFNFEWMNEPLSEWFPDSSNDGNSNFEEDFGDVTSEYKWWNMNDNLYEKRIELNDEGQANQSQAARGEANEGEPNQGEVNEGEPNQGEAGQGAANQMDNNEGNDDVHEREEGGQEFPNEIYPGASQPATEIDDNQGGVFRAPTPLPNAGPTDVTAKTWQKKKQTVTRDALLRARSSREKKINPKYLD
ncbi:hypothetical protein POM88_014277 [Heracleum sosnowskyi]|uniref:Uncharacterized protein n=1 Tax=Heracleum sosnowskyi TaxID=360622 RepID=A0AAD8N436_9APIA|nr:hypothetical protein POM88_014277 [Heracleum sosnowskyi]